LADQQAKQTGLEKDFAKRDAELNRVESAQKEVNKDKNALSLERVKLGQEGKKADAIFGANMYSTDVKRQTDLQQLALQKQQIANQGAYYQKSLSLTEARIKSMDQATQARYAQMKINAMKLLKDDQGYVDLQGQLRQKYKDTWQSNPEAQRLLQNYQAAFIGNMLDNQGALIGGARDAASLLQD
jgi:hypothetical protein